MASARLQPPANGFLAAWDTSAGYADTCIGDTLLDTGLHALHVESSNRQVREQTGFDGVSNDYYRIAPAIIYRLWEKTKSFTVRDVHPCRPSDSLSQTSESRSPAGKGFSLNVRMYVPKEDVRNGRWFPAPIIGKE